MKFRLVFILLSFAIITCNSEKESGTNLPPDFLHSNVHFPIKGISFVATKNPVSSKNLKQVKQVNATWIAQMPFAFCKAGQPKVYFNPNNNKWWGETDNGIIATHNYALENNLQEMLKPQLWMSGNYTGHFQLNEVSDWLIWENDYRDFILHFAHVADTLQIPLFCIGTELQKTIESRPDFWLGLIDTIRKVYSGKLTYAANWDEYKLVPFWSQLDYIGIDAYFPLSKAETPLVNELFRAWQDTIRGIEKWQRQFNLPIIFTEIGYKSVNQCAWEPWNPESKKVNLKAQRNAYIAFLSAFQKKEWFAGCFIWKWYPETEVSGGENNSDYTPQNKPSGKVLKKWFE